MNKRKLYLKNKYDEFCYRKKTILSMMKLEGIDEMVVYEAKVERMEDSGDRDQL